MTDVDEEVRLAVQYSRNYVSASPFANQTAKEHIDGLCNLVEKLQSALQGSLRQAADDCEDADRYRWLRDWKSPSRVTITFDCEPYAYVGERLDLAVDTARTPKEQTK